jgi:hypothetical protein
VYLLMCVSVPLHTHTHTHTHTHVRLSAAMEAPAFAKGFSCALEQKKESHYYV